MPELEVFDSDIQLAKMLIEKGVLDSPALFQIVTGIRFGFAVTPQTMAYAKSMLPPDAHWAGFGIGRMAYRTGFALAEWLCRATDRINPA